MNRPAEAFAMLSLLTCISCGTEKPNLYIETWFIHGVNETSGSAVWRGSLGGISGETPYDWNGPRPTELDQCLFSPLHLPDYVTAPPAEPLVIDIEGVGQRTLVYGANGLVPTEALPRGRLLEPGNGIDLHYLDKSASVVLPPEAMITAPAMNSVLTTGQPIDIRWRAEGESEILLFVVYLERGTGFLGALHTCLLKDDGAFTLDPWLIIPANPNLIVVHLRRERTAWFVTNRTQVELLVQQVHVRSVTVEQQQ